MLRSTTLLALIASSALSAQTINQSGLGFTPPELTVQLGATITFTIGAPHNATQVSETTWNANGTTPLPGGFLFSSGTHTFTPTAVGTYYYLCTVHPSLMHGKIIVETNTGVTESVAPMQFAINPNPVSDVLVVSSDPATTSILKLMDLQGREVLAQRLTGSDRISVGQLPEGNYVAVAFDREGRMVEQKRLSIRH